MPHIPLLKLQQPSGWRLESDDGSQEVDNVGNCASDGADEQDSNNAGPSWLDEDNVVLGVNSIGGDTHPTGSSLDAF